MVALYDVNEKTGGMELIPNTHTDKIQEEFRQRYPDAKNHTKDWVKLSTDDPWQKGQARIIKLKPGEILLWDSRIVHGGKCGTGYSLTNNPLGTGDLARLSFTVSYSRKSQVKDPVVLYKRRKTFLDGKCALNHWAHEYNPAFMLGYGGKNINFDMKDFKNPTETAQITSLLGMSQEEYDKFDIKKPKVSKKRKANAPLNDRENHKKQKSDQ